MDTDKARPPLLKKTLLLSAVAACLLPSLGITLFHVVQLGRQPSVGLVLELPSPDKVFQTPTPVQAPPGSITMVVLDSPAFHAGLAVYDKVLSIEGVPLTDRSRLEALDRSVREGQPVRFRVKSGEREREAVLRPTYLLRCVHAVPELASTFVLVVIFLAVSLLVYLRRPGDPRAILLLLISTLAAGSYLLIPLFLFMPASPLGILDFGSGHALFATGFVLSFLFAIVLPVCFLHLALIFPKPLPLVERQPRLIRWIYVAAFGIPLATVAILFGTGLTAGLAESSPRWCSLATVPVVIGLLLLGARRISRPLRQHGWTRPLLDQPLWTLASALAMILLLLALAVFLHTGLDGPPWLVYLFLIPLFIPVLLSLFVTIIGYPVLTCVAMIANYRRSGPEEKRQLRWPLWGTCVALGGNILLGLGNLALTLLAPHLGPWLMPVTLMLGKPLYLLIPVSFAVAILKYRLMDIDLIIRKTVIYSIVSGIVLALCFLQAVAGILLFRQLGLEGIWGTVFASLVVAALLVPLHRLVQRFVDRRFFRSRFDYPAALDLLRRQAGQSEERSSLLRLTLETVQQALRPRTQAVLLPAGAVETFRVADSIGVPDHLAHRASLALATPLRDRLDHGGILLRPEVEAAGLESIEKLSPEAILPLQSGLELMGLLLVGKKYPNRNLEEEDLEFLRQTAALTADGLARLENRHQARDLEAARAIQQRFLPQQIPVRPGLEIATVWEPSRRVGGDYFDIVELDHERLGVVIADVSGKGLPAALLMSNLQAAFRALATAGLAPEQLCLRLNEILRRQMVGGMFVTLFYGCYDPLTRRLVSVNAGHCPPIHLKAAGQVELLEEGGTILGAFPNPVYRPQATDLAPGDLLLLYTDGFPEAENPAGEPFGEGRIIAAFREGHENTLQTIVTGLAGAVREHARGEPQDDLTMVVLSAKTE